MSRSPYTPVLFEPKAASPELWAAYHAYRHVRHAETRPDDPPWPDHLVEEDMRRDDPFGDDRHFLVLDGDRVISGFYAGRVKPGSPGYDTNHHLVWASASVLRDARRRGIGTLWAGVALDLMHEWGTTVLTMWTEEEDGQAFLTWLGAEQKSIGAENRLDMREVDWAMLERWIADGRERSPESRAVFYPHRIPEAEWAEFCPAMSDMLNTMPFDDLDHGEIVFTPEMLGERYAKMDASGASHNTLFTREPDGTISSITDMHFQPEQPDRIFQQFTGVRPDCRGRGLGKLIKASMLEYVRDTYPDVRWVVTGNADSNDPMLAINRRMGFKTYRTSRSYQIGRDALAAKLGRA